VALGAVRDPQSPWIAAANSLDDAHNMATIVGKLAPGAATCHWEAEAANRSMSRANTDATL
jgi:hypothetical protein